MYADEKHKTETFIYIILWLEFVNRIRREMTTMVQTFKENGHCKDTDEGHKNYNLKDRNNGRMQNNMVQPCNREREREARN